MTENFMILMLLMECNRHRLITNINKIILIAENEKCWQCPDYK